MKRSGLTALALAGLLAGSGGAGVVAQQQDKEKQKIREVVVDQEPVVVAPAPGGFGVGVGTGQGTSVSVGGDHTFVFVSSEMAIDGKVVKGVPYSADAVTETTQTLADGNRIVRKNTAQVYRDGEGRTRREHTISVIGPFATEGDPPRTVFINDPVAGASYILDPRSRTARKVSVVRAFERTPDGGAAKARAEVVAQGQAKLAGEGAAGQEPTRRMRSPGYVFSTATPGAPAGVGPHPGGPDVMFYRHDGTEPKVEKLASQTIEGVLAEGQKITHTIPAGAIGNEQPIDIVDERWYSPELQTVVMTRHSDPRSGETVFRLTNINRSEPARTLFEVPSDYTVREVPSGVNTFRRKKAEAGAQKENNFQFYYNRDERQQ